VRFVDFENRDAALDQLRRQAVDLVVSAQAGDGSPTYWVDAGTPRGYVAERLLIGAGQAQAGWIRRAVSVEALPYGAWLFPGLLALNLMGMSLYGVGGSIVRARHSGVLRRFRVTSATAAEFLIAQILSRVLLMTFTGAVLYAGCALVYGFTCRGSLPALALTLLAGTLSATALGLLTASRSDSPELVIDVINFMAPAMMLLGGVWFPLTGVPDWLSTLAHALPVTRCVEAARAIMNEGASLADVSAHLTFLTVFTGGCLALGAALFRWHRDD
jgi:ABC transporter DrrB family efflux protein